MFLVQEAQGNIHGNLIYQVVGKVKEIKLRFQVIAQNKHKINMLLDVELKIMLMEINFKDHWYLNLFHKDHQAAFK